MSIMEKANIETRNEMSGVALVNKYGPIEFIKSPKTNKLFFMVGDIKGYASPKVAERLDDENFTEHDIHYAEVSIDGGKFVPTLMVSNKQNVVRTMGKRA